MSVRIRPYRRGGWEVDITFRLPNGRRHRERTKAPVDSKSRALRWGQDRERHLLQHGLEQPKKEVPTIKEFAPRFIADYARANRHKPSGIAAKETILNTHLVPFLGSHRLDEIQNGDVQQLKQHLGSKAAKTVNNVLTVLNVMLKMAAEWGVIERVSCSIRLLPVEQKQAGFFDFEEFERLVEAARNIDPRTHLLVLLGGEAGLRAGEMVALRWADVDFVTGRLSVRCSDWRGELTSTKSLRTRHVDMTERLATALRQHRHLRNVRVLCKDDGKPLTRQGAWSRIRYAAKNVGLKTGVHILRHTFCSRLVMLGAPMSEVQALVGHQALTMTQRYSHLSPKALGNAIRLLEPAAS